MKVPKPRGICVTRDIILVSNAKRVEDRDCSCPPNCVVVFNKVTRQQQEIKENMKAPRGVVVDAAGFIYVADSGNNRILKFNKDYELVATIFQGAIDGKDHLYGMCIVDRKIYIADKVNGCIQVVNLDSPQQDSPKNVPGKNRNPIGIAFDSQKKVFYVAFESSGIDKFDAEFNYIDKIRKIKKGKKELELDNLRGITVSSKRELIFVAKHCEDQILCFNMNEECVKETDRWKDSKFVNCQVVALDPDDDYLYVGKSGELLCIKLDSFLNGD